MNIFGITLTPGHLIFGAVLVVLYDAIWTWVFNNPTAAWWFERVQGWLKLAVYTGFLAIVALIVFMPWPWNLILVIAIAACAFSFVMWRKHRS